MSGKSRPSGCLQSGTPCASNQDFLRCGPFLAFYILYKVLSAHPWIYGAACLSVSEDSLDTAQALCQAQSYICYLSFPRFFDHLRIGYLGPSHGHQVCLPFHYYPISHDRALDSSHCYDRNRNVFLHFLAEVDKGSLVLIHRRYVDMQAAVNSTSLCYIYVIDPLFLKNRSQLA